MIHQNDMKEPSVEKLTPPEVMIGEIDLREPEYDARLTHLKRDDMDGQSENTQPISSSQSVHFHHLTEFEDTDLKPMQSDSQSILSDSDIKPTLLSEPDQKRFFFDSDVINHLNQSTLRVLTKWNQVFNQTNYLDADGVPIYQLVIVGGTAFNIYLPKTEEVLTFDLDLKLAYTKTINVDEYFRLYQNRFNRLRTQIMLDLKWQINNSILANRYLKEYFAKRIKLIKGDYFQVAINYKYPYQVNSYDDAFRCSKVYPEMTHMVMSLNYYPIDQMSHQSLIDLSMFVNLNNPDRLYHLPLNNYLYIEGMKRNRKPLATHQLQFISEASSSSQSIEVQVLLPGAILADLFWLSMLHHKPEKRHKYQTKLNRFITALSQQSIISESDQTKLLTLIKEDYISLGYKLLDYFYLPGSNLNSHLTILPEMTPSQEQLLENLNQLEHLFAHINLNEANLTLLSDIAHKQFPLGGAPLPPNPLPVN